MVDRCGEGCPARTLTRLHSGSLQLRGTMVRVLVGELVPR